MSGLTSYHAGLAAEEVVCRTYVEAGARKLAERWRGKSGEIDLVFEDADGLVFVEVKAAATHELAASRLSIRQIGRVARAAEEFVATLGRTDAVIRLDAALVDRQGRVDRIANISMI